MRSIRPLYGLIWLIAVVFYLLIWYVLPLSGLVPGLQGKQSLKGTLDTWNMPVCVGLGLWLLIVISVWFYHLAVAMFPKRRGPLKFVLLWTIGSIILIPF